MCFGVPKVSLLPLLPKVCVSVSEFFWCDLSNPLTPRRSLFHLQVGFCFFLVADSWFTVYYPPPPKLNIDPEEWWLEDDPFLLGRELFRGKLLNFGGVTFVFFDSE